MNPIEAAGIVVVSVMVLPVAFTVGTLMLVELFKRFAS